MLKQLLFLLAMGLGFVGRAQNHTVVDVWQIFQNKCISCHNPASPAGNLDLQGVGATDLARAQNVAAKLVNVSPDNTFAAQAGQKRVYPGRPDKSALFRKINNGFDAWLPALAVQEGQSMPGYPNSGPLTDLEKETIRQWIAYGAKNSGASYDKQVVENFYNGIGYKAFPDGPPPAPAPGTGFQVKMGPFYLPPSGEVEFYQKYELALPADVEVNRVEVLISGFSHHFILYNFTSPAGANAVPHGLRTNANHFDISLTAAVQEQTDLQLPAGTAFKWDKNIILDLNSHYINYSDQHPYQCEAYLNIYTQPIGTAEQEMFASLLVNPFIPIPNNGNIITHTKSEFQAGADSIYVWGLMGHTHKYGTSYKVWKRLPGGGKSDLIYDASCPQGVPGCPSPIYDYQHIPLRYFQPFLPVKWSNGVVHEAQWINNGPAAVNFGPTSDDEMMVLIAFYTLEPLSVSAHEPLALSQPRAIPNPATDRVALRHSDGAVPRSLTIWDASGRPVLNLEQENKTQFEISVRHFPAGLYFYSLDGQQGKLVVGPQ